MKRLIAAIVISASMSGCAGLWTQADADRLTMQLDQMEQMQAGLQSELASYKLSLEEAEATLPEQSPELEAARKNVAMLEAQIANIGQVIDNWRPQIEEIANNAITDPISAGLDAGAIVTDLATYFFPPAAILGVFLRNASKRRKEAEAATKQVVRAVDLAKDESADGTYTLNKRILKASMGPELEALVTMLRQKG